jgi:hypothetical protein
MPPGCGAPKAPVPRRERADRATEIAINIVNEQGESHAANQ